MAIHARDQAVLTEVFVVAKSINSLGQIEASVASVVVALSGPLVESDTVYLSRADAQDEKDRLEGHVRLGASDFVSCQKERLARLLV